MVRVQVVSYRLVARGHDVVDVFGPDRANEHDLTRFAVAEDGRVVYPPDEDEEEDDDEDGDEDE